MVLKCRQTFDSHYCGGSGYIRLVETTSEQTIHLLLSTWENQVSKEKIQNIKRYDISKSFNRK